MKQRTGSVVKAAIILARDENGLQPVFGIPAVRRLALLTLQLCFEAIHIIGHMNGFKRVLSDLAPSQAFHHMEDPALLDQVIEELALPDEARILVLRANHVIDRRSLEQFIETADEPGVYCLQGEDESVGGGIYLAGPSDLATILRGLWSHERPHPRVLERIQCVQGIDGLPHVIEREGARIAETKLMGALGLQTETSDSLLARNIDRRVSRLVSKGLARTRVTPNQITLIGFILGVLGAFLLSRGTYWSQLTGSLLFLSCVVLDGVDGELARLKLRETTFGHYLDIVTDNIANIAVFAGIALGLYRDSSNVWYLYALCLMMGGFGLCAIAVYQCVLWRRAVGIAGSPKGIQIMNRMVGRDFAYLVVALALFNKLHWFLIGAAGGTYLFAAVLWILNFHDKLAKNHRAQSKIPGK